MFIIPISEGFLPCPNTLNTWFPEEYFFMNMSLDNYDGLADPREHVQNMHDSLDMIIQDHDSICKIFPTTFKWSVHYWYNNLEPYFIEDFSDLYAKLVACFSINIPTKKTSIELFGVT
jgi:hypothetical protein